MRRTPPCVGVRSPTQWPSSIPRKERLQRRAEREPENDCAHRIPTGRGGRERWRETAGAPGEGGQFTLTLMLFGFASARLGTKMRSTPFLCSAVTLSGSRVGGRVKLRANVPYARSIR